MFLFFFGFIQLVYNLRWFKCGILRDLSATSPRTEAHGVYLIVCTCASTAPSPLWTETRSGARPLVSATGPERRVDLVKPQSVWRVVPMDGKRVQVSLLFYFLSSVDYFPFSSFFGTRGSVILPQLPSVQEWRKEGSEGASEWVNK